MKASILSVPNAHLLPTQCMEEDQLMRDHRIKAHIQAVIELAEEELNGDDELGE